MPWVRLDDRFDENPKILAAGVAAAGLYAMALAYSNRNGTDGFVPAKWAHYHGGKRHAEKLVETGLWREELDGYYIPDFLEYNLSAAEIEERRRVRAEAGRVAGIASGTSRRSRAQRSANDQRTIDEPNRSPDRSSTVERSSNSQSQGRTTRAVSVARHAEQRPGLSDLEQPILHELTRARPATGGAAA